MQRTQRLSIFLLLPLSMLLGGCVIEPPNSTAGPGGSSAGRASGRGDRTQETQEAVVEFLAAVAGSLDGSATYTGTTEPQQQVGLRSQITAQLLDLTVEIGDRVTQGEVIAQLDPNLLQAAVREAEAELAVREVELAQTKTALAEAQTAIRQAKAELKQAQVDARRLRSLAQQGAIAQQQAELAETTLQVAQQTFHANQAQAQTREQAIAAAQQRVAAQTAVVAQERERASFTTLVAPITGVVLAQLAETGDLVQAGQEIVTLGDISDTQVVIQISDQARGQVSPGQPVQVQIDAFPGRSFAGTVERISPVADAASRLLPVEISLATAEPLGSGLLARVNLRRRGGPSVVIPESALGLGAASLDNEQAGETAATVFVVAQDERAPGERATGERPLDERVPDERVPDERVPDESIGGDRPGVRAQPVQLGATRNGQVEIISGLAPGEVYVAKSSQPLSDGQQVRRSLVSEF